MPDFRFDEESAMPAKVVLTMKEGDREINRLSFGNRTIGIVGRAGNCYIQLPNDLAHLVVSRHHCLLDINPPEVRVQDLGSRNGTFVNEVIIGQRRRHADADDTIEEESPPFSLKDGDQLRVGYTVFQVDVVDEPQAILGLDEFLPTRRQLCGSSVN
jgi:pSer/pThr/pTyr-binding forkhead associated (FHA) protein